MPAWGALLGGVGGVAIFLILTVIVGSADDEKRRRNGKSASDAYDDFHHMSFNESDGRFR